MSYYYYHPDLPLEGYSFDRENSANARTERPTALALREAFDDLLMARAQLEAAQDKVPNYTGQWRDADYVRDEEQTLVVASHAFEDALVASVAARTNVS